MTISRRNFLSGTLAAGATAGLLAANGEKLQAAVTDASSEAPGSFSFIHLTDQHVTHRRHAPEGYAKCIAALNALKPGPDFVLMGGDMVFDGGYTALDDYKQQLHLFQDITRDLKYPWHPCLGNHDILGWNSREKVTPTDAGYGKKLLMDALEWKDPYYSFDHKGWHFAVLDSAYPAQHDGRIIQEPRLGPEQLEWLGYDLGSAGDRPKIAVVHVAAFCNVGQISGDPKKLAMDGSMVIWDTQGTSQSPRAPQREVVAARAQPSRRRHILERHFVRDRRRRQRRVVGRQLDWLRPRLHDHPLRRRQGHLVARKLPVGAAAR